MTSSERQKWPRVAATTSIARVRARVSSRERNARGRVHSRPLLHPDGGRHEKPLPVMRDAGSSAWGGRVCVGGGIRKYNSLSYFNNRRLQHG